MTATDPAKGSALDRQLRRELRESERRRERQYAKWDEMLAAGTCTSLADQEAELAAKVKSLQEELDLARAAAEALEKEEPPAPLPGQRQGSLEQEVTQADFARFREEHIVPLSRGIFQ